MRHRAPSATHAAVIHDTWKSSHRMHGEKVFCRSRKSQQLFPSCWNPKQRQSRAEYANEEMGGGAGGDISHWLCKQNECFVSVDVFLAAQRFSVAHRWCFSEMTLGGSFPPQGIRSESARTASTLAVGREADLKFLSLGDGGSEDDCAAVGSFLKRVFFYSAILSGSFCLPGECVQKIHFLTERFSLS